MKQKSWKFLSLSEIQLPLLPIFLNDKWQLGSHPLFDSILYFYLYYGIIIAGDIVLWRLINILAL